MLLQKAVNGKPIAEHGEGGCSKNKSRGVSQIERRKVSKTSVRRRGEPLRDNRKSTRTEPTEREANTDQSLVSRAVNGGECPFYNLSFTSFPRSIVDCRFAKTLRCLKGKGVTLRKKRSEQAKRCV